MTKKKKTKSDFESIKDSSSCCRVEYVTKIDDRGQMVLPKEIREKAKIRPGEKLAVISMEKDGKVCCISLIRAEDLEGKVKDLLGPVMKEILKE
ncbi:MAG: HgcAB-associated protein HgcC [Candidatus Hodarchaeota archaeon]